MKGLAVIRELGSGLSVRLKLGICVSILSSLYSDILMHH